MRRPVLNAGPPRQFLKPVRGVAQSRGRRWPFRAHQLHDCGGQLQERKYNGKARQGIRRKFPGREIRRNAHAEKIRNAAATTLCRPAPAQAGHRIKAEPAAKIRCCRLPSGRQTRRQGGADHRRRLRHRPRSRNTLCARGRGRGDCPSPGRARRCARHANHD